MGVKFSLRVYLGVPALDGQASFKVDSLRSVAFSSFTALCISFQL
jgi:hypothetical protein